MCRAHLGAAGPAAPTQPAGPARHVPELVPPTHGDPPVGRWRMQRRADPRRRPRVPASRHLMPHPAQKSFRASGTCPIPQLRPGPDCARTGVRTKLLAVIVWIALVVWLGLVIWSLSVVRAAAGADAPAPARTRAPTSGVPFAGRRRLMADQPGRAPGRRAGRDGARLGREPVDAAAAHRPAGAARARLGHPRPGRQALPDRRVVHGPGAGDGAARARARRGARPRLGAGGLHAPAGCAAPTCSTTS